MGRHVGTKGWSEGICADLRVLRVPLEPLVVIRLPGREALRNMPGRVARIVELCCAGLPGDPKVTGKTYSMNEDLRQKMASARLIESRASSRAVSRQTLLAS